LSLFISFFLSIFDPKTDAQASIPIGTISAIFTTSVVYLSCTLLFGASVDRLLLLDKFGESLQAGDGGKMVASLLVWPHPYFMVVGSCLSTIGAGLQLGWSRRNLKID
jgi:potassium/chloride transporter 4/5/6